MRARLIRFSLGLLASMALLAAACGSGGDPAGGEDGAGAGAGDDGAGSGGGGGGGGGDDGAGGGAGAGDDAGGGCAIDGDPFDPAALRAGVEFLASDELAGRAPGTAGDAAARMHIEERFRCLGLTAAGPGGSFQQPFEAPDGLETANVVAYAPGSDAALSSEVIVVGAHHDHLGTMGGEVYNGANDNASGVTAMLAVAQAIQRRGTPPRRTIVFAAFGYEENVGDCLGSEFYVDNAPEGLPIDRVVYMVNSDMVGTYPSEEQVSAYGSVPGTPGRALLDDLVAGQADMTFQLGDTADEDDSDFQAFCDLGIPYVYFETWDEECYHSPCDDADRLDYEHMSSLAALMKDLVIGLADTDADLAAARGQGACPL